MSRKPCCVGEGLKKGAWTTEEDKKLISYIHEYGEGGWRDIPQKAGLKRCGKSCRLRWANYLKPDIKRGGFSYEEEQIIIMLHASRGNKWSVIARHLPKRTDNEIKNYWNTHLKKRLIDQGIDPVTHKPLASNPNPTTSKTSDSNQKSMDEESKLQSPTMSPKSISHSSSSCNLPEISSSNDETLRNNGSLSPKKRCFKRSSSTSNLLNEIATRASSIGNIISASMEISYQPPCNVEEFSENTQFQVDESDQILQPSDHITDHTKEDMINMNIDDFKNSDDDFSQFIKHFSHNEGQEAENNINGGYNQDLLMSDVSSTIVDEDNMMPNINCWSNFLDDHLDFTYDLNRVYEDNNFI